jgi:hypothetical protein
VQLRVPPGSSGEALAAALQGSVTDLVADLAVPRDVEVSLARQRRRLAAVTASIDGRPVAHRAAPDVGQHGTGGLERSVLEGILRRLSLLLGGHQGPHDAARLLVDVGCGRSSLVGDGHGVEAMELALDARADDVIVVEVSEATFRRADNDAQRAVVRMREGEFRKYGASYPDVRVVPTDDLAGHVRLRLNDVWLPAHQLGTAADWTDVVALLGRELSARRHWFLRVSDVSSLLDSHLGSLFPELVAVTRANYSAPLLTASLRELLRSGKRIRNLPRILWMLLEQGAAPAGPDVLRLAESPLLPKTTYGPRAYRDPVLLASRVRKSANEESWWVGNYTIPRHAVRLAPEVEEALMHADTPRRVAHAEWAAVRAVATDPDVGRVVVRTSRAIGPVRDALQALTTVPRVTASQELPPDADLTSFPVVRERENGA